jgi:diacylglycerol kinase (ATP)
MMSDEINGNAALSTAASRRDSRMNEPNSGITPSPRPFEFTGRVRSFRHATRGIVRMVSCQHNAWIHAVATLLVVSAGFFLHLSPSDWCWIILAISIVWTAEALNTAFEFVVDVASPTFHPVVRDAKDVAAGAVLITAVAAAIIGLIIFWPHLVSAFHF